MSRFPLFGLIHKINVKTITEGDDGFGGISITTAKRLSNLKCRITLLSAMDKQELFGEASGEMWKILVNGNPNILEQEIIELSGQSKAAPIVTGVDYRVKKARIAQDDVGSIHHETIFVEKEDVNG